MRLPERTGCIIIGAGFAGAATAWALARAGVRTGVILEREPTPGQHASGRNAALVRQTDGDPLIHALSVRSLEHIRRLPTGGELVHQTGSLTVAGDAAVGEVAAVHDVAGAGGLRTELLSAPTACGRFPFLERLRLDVALWCPTDGVADIHALLMSYLAQARERRFELHTGCGADGLVLEAGRVVGVRSGTREIRADVVVDACGAWAGRLAGEDVAALRPLRRHLFVSGPFGAARRTWPYTWVAGAEVYFRPEGAGLLLSPCDETPSPPGVPSTDPAAALLLAEKLAVVAPGLADLTLRRSWACLRTFAPDRRPVIGPDPLLPGLFHVSGLGGFGMTASAAIGELAACTITGTKADWIDFAAVSPARFGRGGAMPARVSRPRPGAGPDRLA
jgi:D-arginine dehydrogenase